jgi:hypothetical protein
MRPTLGDYYLFLDESPETTLIIHICIHHIAYFIFSLDRNSLVVGGNSEADHTFTNLPGIGMLANFHPVLSNGRIF